MSIDPELVAKAVEIFRNKKVSRSDDIVGGVHLLEGYRQFEDMDAAELEAHVRAALAQLGNARRHPETGGSRGDGGKPRALPEFNSPFVFVALPDQVASAAVDVPVDIPIRDGYCATIDYCLQAETPILIGAEAERNGPDEGVVLPIRGADGNYVIPGATIRGLVRAAVEIVAHGKLGSANLHHRFGIRDFEHPYYEQVAKVALVKAGWLSGEIDGSGNAVTMRITPCDWSHVLIDDLAASTEFKGKVSARTTWIQNSQNQKYTALGMVARVSGQRTEFNFTKTFGYGPAVEDNGRQVRKPAKGGVAGVPVVSGKLPGSGGNKKFEYAFFDRPGAEPVPIRPELIDDFVRLNSKPSKNRPVPDGSWKELKATFDAGARIPVFYVGDLIAQGHDFFFGLTRMLKLPHERSVGEVLGQQPNHLAAAQWRETAGGMQEIVRYSADFVESLFGFVVEPKDLLDSPGSAAPRGVARKGRIAFSFAELVDGPASAKLSDPVTLVQSAPRASYSPFYLKPQVPGQKGAEADYSALKPPRIAGRKRYMPRDPQPNFNGRLRAIKAMGERQLDAIRKSSGGRAPSADVQSRLRFLLPRNGDSPLLFEGKIRLHNVTAAELGAVLFALSHGGDPSKPYRHMIGRAKPFGAGQTRLRSLDLAVEPNSNMPVIAPDPDERLNEATGIGFCSSASTASIRPFLTAFTAHMRRQPGLQAFPNVDAVLEFLGASNPTSAAADDEKLDYMALQAFNPVRKATKPLKDPRAGPPARGIASDGRLLPAPRVAKPVFWT